MITFFSGPNVGTPTVGTKSFDSASNLTLSDGPTSYMTNRSSCWSAGPRRPSDESDAIVAGCLYMYLAGYLAIWLSGYIFMSRRRFLPRFQCLVSPPLQLPCQKGQPGYRCFDS